MRTKAGALGALMKRAYREVRPPEGFILACALGIPLSLSHPTDLARYPEAPPPQPWAVFTEDYLRFANTAVQVALPLVMRDTIGMVQLVYVGVSTTLATHGIKRIVDDWEVGGTRLGERPSGPGSMYNMPSGHASQASCAVYFVGRRYGWWHLAYLVPILLLTMCARVALNAHTVSAVIAGALIGLVTAAIFTSKRNAGRAGPVRR